MNPTAVICFVLIVVATLAITAWAARRTRGAQDFYAAGGKIGALQNGLALAGDAVSAGAFLGLSGLIFAKGFDGFFYAIGYACGMPIVVFLVAERLRRLGRYTFTDVVCARLDERPMRLFGAASALVVIAFYLVAQMVGAGALIQLLFGLPYAAAVCIVGTLMVAYVLFGGMIATTWVQIVKAVLMLGIGAILCVMILGRYGFSFADVLGAASGVHPMGASLLAPQAAGANPWSTVSLGLALMFGTAGLPHVLMRFLTVRDPRTARNSVVWGTAFISSFYASVAILGFGAIAIIARDPGVVLGGQVIGGGNMVVIHLARILGGNAMLGLVSAIAFATILAVVSGLTLAGAAAISHDLYARVVRKGKVDEKAEIRVSRGATLALGLVAIAAGIAFQGQNVAYMIGLAFAIACSSTFPVLLLALYWRGLTTRGALAGGCAGLVSAVALTVLGPSVWVKVLGFSTPVVALDPPTLITMPLAFCVCYLVSALDQAGQAQAAAAP